MNYLLILLNLSTDNMSTNDSRTPYPCRYENYKKIETRHIKRTEYLNLELVKDQVTRERHSYDNYLDWSLQCNFANGAHNFHSDKNPELNTIIDLIINLGRNLLRTKNDYLKPIKEKLTVEIKPASSIDPKPPKDKISRASINKLSENIDFLKLRLDQLPTEKKVVKLIESIIGKPKEIEEQTKQSIIELQLKLATCEQTIEEVKKLTEHINSMFTLQKSER